MRRLLALALATALPSAAATGASDTVSDAVARALAIAGPGARIGLLVVDETGHALVSLRPDERFVPASNTKLFTTAAVFATLEVNAPDAAGGATVRLEGEGRTPDVVLTGHGDARLSSAPDCQEDCLATLAAAVAARTRRVHDIVGDDSAFPDERWSLGMSWNNLAGRYGTANSALTIDDNEVAVTVRPTHPGAPALIQDDGYLPLDNRVLTSAAGTPAALHLERDPGGTVLHVVGNLPVGAPPATLVAGIDDPAHRAAWRLAALLRAAGVHVTGSIRVRHRVPQWWDDPAARGGAPAPRLPEPPILARLVPPPLTDDISHTNKMSQNLHAELMLRRLGRVRGAGSVADGHAMVDATLARAGIASTSYTFADGAGMSTYNRVTPATTVTLLRWAQTQPWGAAWRASFPVAATDGTLRRRFANTPLAGRLSAKTGTLNAATALAGYFTAASGRTLTFAAYANDMVDDARGTAAIDAALVAVAAAN